MRIGSGGGEQPELVCGGCGAPVFRGLLACANCGFPFVEGRRRTKQGAPPLRRLVGWLVDLSLIGVLVVATTLATGLLGGWQVVVIPTLYCLWFEARGEQTPGRQLLGLRVVRLDGSTSLGVTGSLVRSLGRWLGAFPLAAGFLWAFGPRRTWHDWMSRTVVVRSDEPLVIAVLQPTRADDAVENPAQDAGGEPVFPSGPDPTWGLLGGVEEIWGDAEQLRQLGLVAWRCGHPNEAGELLAAALRCAGNEGPEWANVALCWLDAGRVADALQVVNWTLFHHPTSGLAAAVKALALCEASESNAEEATALARRAILHDAAHPLGPVSLGWGLVCAGERDQGTRLLAEQVEGAEGQRAHLLLVRAAMRAGDREQFRTLAREAARRWGGLECDYFAAIARGPLPAYRLGKSRGFIEGCIGLDGSAKEANELAKLLERVPQAPGVRARLAACGIAATRRRRPELRSAGAVVFLLYLLARLTTEANNRLGPNAAGLLLLASLPFVFLATARLLYSLRQRRLLTENTRSWHEYAVATRAWERAPYSMPCPTAPAASVLGNPAKCCCSDLERLAGAEAVAHAQLHLVHVRELAGGVHTLHCPGQLTRWLLLESDLGPQLVRLEPPTSLDQFQDWPSVH